MAQTKYIKDKSGRFAGSIGTGKSQVPTAPARPMGVSLSIKDISKLKYDPQAEVKRFELAMTKGNGVIVRARRARARYQLEMRFGTIDWSGVSA